MKNFFLKDPRLPLALSADIAEDTEIRLFIASPLSEKSVSLPFQVLPGVKLSLTLVDLSLQDCSISIQVVLQEKAEARLQIAAISSGHTDKVYRVDVLHQESDTFSRTSMIGINGGDGKLSFLGSSHIVNGAHRSDTRQEGKITNLHPNAKSEVSPALLIQDNDVKASHGASLGAYNPEQLFYLMSRGLSLAESKKLITYGQLLPILESLNDPSLVQEAKTKLGGMEL